MRRMHCHCQRADGTVASITGPCLIQASGLAMPPKSPFKHHRFPRDMILCASVGICALRAATRGVTYGGPLMQAVVHEGQTRLISAVHRDSPRGAHRVAVLGGRPGRLTASRLTTKFCPLAGAARLMRRSSSSHGTMLPIAPCLPCGCQFQAVKACIRLRPWSRDLLSSLPGPASSRRFAMRLASCWRQSCGSVIPSALAQASACCTKGVPAQT